MTRTATKELTAYVNHGRWVADCACAAGLLLHVGDQEADCSECQRVYDSIVWPARSEIEAAEAVLGLRPKHNRNWFPWKETVGDLVAENLDHDLQGGIS